MQRTGTRVADVSYTANTGRFRGTVTFFGPGGIHSLRVAAPGHPTWGFDRVAAALVDAARDAAGAPP